MAARAASTKSMGQPAYVAKVYHKRPLPEDQVAKLQAMIALLVERPGNDLGLAAVDAVRSDVSASRAAS